MISTQPTSIGAARVAARGQRPAPGKRRVCLLACPLGWGGSELHTVQLARTLLERGNAVTVLEFGQALFAEHGHLPPEVRLITLRLDVPPEQVSFRRWVRILRGLDCEAAVFAKGQVHLGSVALDLAARLCFRRFIAIEHVSPPVLPAPRSKRHFGFVPGLGLWRRRLQWQVYRRSLGPHRIIGVSRALLGELGAYHFPRRKLVAVPNGIDAERYRPDPVQRAAQRAQWGVPADAFVFGTVGRLVIHHKGQDLAIEAFARVRAQNPQLDPWYVLVGEGPDQARLEAIAHGAGVAHRVIFAGYTDRPWEAQTGLDVFVLSSHMEGTPLALLEAMAAGVRPIAMNVGGVADVIADPGIGWLVRAGDRPALLAAMQAALLQAPAEREAMSARAREHVRRSFQARTQFGKIAELVEQG
ncbi:MAG TPA: glycosyltransferase [Gemmatimonadales bacterium]|nr:glycosyltransferase [Gemmatimonadales bacterium]